MTATYLGIKGTRGVQVFLPNTFPNGATDPCPACPTGFAYMASNGNSTRQSGQFQLRRRLRNGLTSSVQYTFAKAIDDAALGGRGQGISVIAQDWLNLRGERALSNFDQRHCGHPPGAIHHWHGHRRRCTVQWPCRGALLKEWTFGSQVTAGTGLPLTPVYLAAVNGTGVTGSIGPITPARASTMRLPAFTSIPPPTHRPRPAGGAMPAVTPSPVPRNSP